MKINFKILEQSGDFFYTKNDFIGITGIEKQYELLLRGQRGNINYLKDYAGNKIKTVNKIPAQPGKSLQITLRCKSSKIRRKVNG